MELIRSGYDLHIHPLPSHLERLQDDIEVVRAAAGVGMAGVMLKNHYESTAGRAALTNRISQCSTRAYGGLVLNWPAGGLNPFAVESALKMGAAFIWLPTRDAANCLRFGEMDGDFFHRPGISVFDGEKNLLPAIYEIMEVVRRYDAVLATGHISTEETISVCKAGREMGIKMVFTHPEWPRTLAPKEVQREMADLGVMIEKNWMNLAEHLIEKDLFIDNIRTVGPERVYIATDRGQSNRETPVEGMLRCIETLLDSGFHEQEIKMMLCQVPAYLIEGK